jgi:hypothetical protein
MSYDLPEVAMDSTLPSLDLIFTWFDVTNVAKNDEKVLHVVSNQRRRMVHLFSATF